MFAKYVTIKNLSCRKYLLNLRHNTYANITQSVDYVIFMNIKKAAMSTLIKPQQIRLNFVTNLAYICYKIKQVK
jgi:hypothetical protein